MDGECNLPRKDFVRQCKERYKEAVEEVISHAEEAQISSNVDGMINGWDQAAENIFGYSAAEIIGTHFTALIPEDRLDEVEFIKQYIQRGLPLRDFQTTRKRKDGKLVAVSVNIFPLVDPETKAPDGCTVTVRDIRAVNESLEKFSARATDEAMAREALTRRAIFRLITHELRTPLAQILGMNELLIGSGLSLEQAELADRVQNAAHHLLELVSNLLIAAEVETAQIGVSPETTDLHELLQKIQVDFEHCCRQKQIKLELSIDDRIAEPISTDNRCLQIILRQLLANGLKFTEKGTIVLGANIQRDSDHTMIIRFSVTDSGGGIADALGGEIFEPWHQGDISDTRKFGGLGLGLSITRGLVDLLGGTLGIEDSKPGTVVWFDLPVQKGPMSAGQAA